MPYQLFPGKDTQVAKSGEYLKIHLLQQINDSVYFTTGNKIPLYVPMGGQSQPYDISELWGKVHVGDSIIATQMMDTFIKRMPPGNLPPQFKNGDRIITKFKVLGILANDSLKRLDEEKETKAYGVRESKEVEAFLGKKLAGLQRTTSGAFVEIFTPGSGELIQAGNFVSVNYTGSTFAGTVFDSNTDTTFKHVEPLRFSVGVGQMIKGFDEAMPFMRKGGKAKVYIPSTLGYGAAPPPGAPIKPYEHLIFDFTVLDVQASQPAQKK
jgi:FKBP-type peptidyl-prolyl cis-trans isomerase